MTKDCADFVALTQYKALRIKLFKFINNIYCKFSITFIKLSNNIFRERNVKKALMCW